MKRAATYILRILMFALAAWLLHRVLSGSDIDLKATIGNASKPLLLLALLLYGAAQLAGAWRWELLLASHGLRLGFLNALRLTLTGEFFCLALPGAVTGDVVKIACAAQHHPGHLADFAMVDLLDRILGLCGLLLALSLTAAIALLHPIPSGIFPPILLKTLAAICALIPLTLFFLFQIQCQLRQCRQLVRGISGILSHLPGIVAAKLRELNAAMRQQEHHRRSLFAVLAISVGIHLLLLTGTNAAIGHALGESSLTLRQYSLATQLSNATGIFSVTPGGIGLRDLAAADTYRDMRAQPASCAAAIPLVNSLVIIFWDITGALWHTVHRRRGIPPALSSSSSPSNP